MCSWVIYLQQETKKQRRQAVGLILSKSFAWKWNRRIVDWQSRWNSIIAGTSEISQLFVTPWTAACQASLSSIISWSLLKFMSIKSVMLSNHLIFCHPLLFLPSVFHSIRVFSSESSLCIRWPKYWSFSLSISPSNEYSGFISSRIDLFNFPGVQRTLKSLLQHYGLKASILWCSAFFMVQLSHPYMTIGKNIALTILIFVVSEWCLCFLIQSRFVRSRCLLISWLRSPSALILKPKKIKSVTVSTFSPSICHQWWDQMPQC